MLQRSRGKRVSSSAMKTPVASAPNVVWAVDFEFDVSQQGNVLKMCSIVDEHTRECIGGLVDRSMTADRFIGHLEEFIIQRRAPAVRRSDHEPAFIFQSGDDLGVQAACSVLHCDNPDAMAMWNRSTRVCVMSL